MKDIIYLPTKKDLENPEVLKELILAHRFLAELKGLAHSIPNDKILLSSLRLKEAKDSSAIENIITTQDSLYKHQIQAFEKHTANKEVHNYSKALDHGWKKVKREQGLSLSAILEIQQIIDSHRPGFRKVPGTVIKDMAVNKIIYTPPSPEKIPALMNQLEQFINKIDRRENLQQFTIDPLIKMAVIHHQFESIHPFYDGNGRTGRILNILYLVVSGLLESPVLYLSRYIHKTRADYYRLLQKVRDQSAWREWIIYMLKGVSSISQETTSLIKKIDSLFKEYKNTIRSHHKFYSHDLINNIFCYPYTRSKFLAEDMKVSRATASRYLDELAENNILQKNKLGKDNYYVNTKLFNLLKDD